MSQLRSTSNLFQFKVPQITSGDIEYQIQMLLDHQNKCEIECNYGEAEICKQKIEDLHRQLKQQKKNDLKQRQQEDKLTIDQSHLDEFTEFNKFWDDKMGEFDREAVACEQDLIQKHKQEMIQIEMELNNKLPIKPKRSTKALNLEKIEKTQAAQKQYKQADETQKQRLTLELQEEQKYQKQRIEKIKNAKKIENQRQQNELNALRQKIISGKNEQKKNRSIELEKLLQRYQNVKRELAVQQNKETKTQDKFLKTQNSQFMSNYNSIQKR